MKKFTQRLLWFTLIIILIFCSSVLVNYFLIKSERQIIPKSKHILILGDSNTECSINDTIFKSGINVSKSGESYFFSYLKFKKLINENPKIDTLLLAFAPHDIFDNDWMNKGQIQSRSLTYFPLMDFEDIVFLIKKEPKVMLSTSFKFAVNSIPNTAKKLIHKKITNYGGFLNLDRNALKEAQLKLQKGENLRFLRMSNNFDIAKDEITYLNKIITLCQKQNIKLYLINTPKRKEFIEDKRYGKKQFYDLYFNHYKNIDFLDFAELNLPEDNYGDFVHLNKKGAKNFSLFLEQSGLNELSKTYNKHH